MFTVTIKTNVCTHTLVFNCPVKIIENRMLNTFNVVDDLNNTRFYAPLDSVISSAVISGDEMYVENSSSKKKEKKDE